MTTEADNPPAKRRVLLVDDHPIVRHGMAMLIDEEHDLMVCGEASNAAETLRQIERCNPEIAIVDISLQGASGIDLTKSIREQHPALPVLVLSMHEENLYAERALHAGARGFVMKQEAAETVLHAIRTVLRGDIYLSEGLSSKVLRALVDGPTADPERFGVDRLSDRELEVFELIGRGYSTRRIADALHLSVKTIETHRAHIKQKLKLNNATELVHRAFHWIEAGRSAR
jgi:DNA-binding NarL/FixJ family response regulator